MATDWHRWTGVAAGRNLMFRSVDGSASAPADGDLGDDAAGSASVAGSCSVPKASPAALHAVAVFDQVTTSATLV